MFKLSFDFRWISPILVLLFSSQIYGQHYTSEGDGNWTSDSVWSAMQAWEAPTPSTNGGWGSVNIYHNIVLNGNYTLNYPLTIHSGASLTINGNLSGGSTINLNGGNLTVNGNHSGGTAINLNEGNLSVTGDFSKSGGGQVTVGDNSNLTIHGNVTLSARLQIKRGGQAIVDGSVTVNSSNNLIIAESGNTNPSEYADMVIKTDLISTSSGDVTINKNGRLAVYGNVTDSGGGGTFLRLNEDSQAYIHGDLNFTGGGGTVDNDNIGNEDNPYGLYINGEIQNTNGVTNPSDLKTFTINGVDITVPCYNQSTCTLPDRNKNVGDQATMLTLNGSFYDWVAAQPGSPLMVGTLPVTLMHFAVSKITPAFIELKWATASETNNSHFVVLRSQDARSWKEVGTVEGNGTSVAALHYTFKDHSPAQGVNYYMLKQVDFDGMYETFNVIVAQHTGFDYEAKVYPNPTADVLNMSFPVDSLEEKIEIHLFDLTGYLVKSEITSSNFVTWDISALKKATYILNVSAGEKTFTSKKVMKH